MGYIMLWDRVLRLKFRCYIARRMGKNGGEILYGKYSGTEIEFEGTKYLIMRQSDVLAVVQK